ncbi:MAG TPA: hypothetical protein PKD59_12215 [Miltoncostaeaceae bacterium]|nr:hypothetical protein [Miltoncostaeaceae bacterium]
MTPLFRRTPAAAAEVALHGPSRAAVSLHPAPGRWPAHEAADRLGLGVGLAALAAGTSPEARWPAFRDALAALAGRLAAAPPGPLPDDLVDLRPLGAPGGLTVVPWEGPGRARVEVQLLDSLGGTVPRFADRPAASGPFAEVASLALLIALSADREEDRLPLALGAEGVIAWFRESDRRAAPRNALAFALAHADGRLRRAGRPGLPA